MSIRVFIVDDHALVRTGMRMILSAETDIEVVGDAESGEAGTAVDPQAQARRGAVRPAPARA